MLYATTDSNGERHWRRSYEEIVHFINKSNDSNTHDLGAVKGLGVPDKGTE